MAGAWAAAAVLGSAPGSCGRGFLSCACRCGLAARRHTGVTKLAGNKRFSVSTAAGVHCRRLLLFKGLRVHLHRGVCTKAARPASHAHLPCLHGLPPTPRQPPAAA